MRKINKNRKGLYAENQVREHLEARGYLVWKPSRSRFNSNDIFGLFDMLAVHPARKTLWIQVKHKSSYSSKVKESIQRFADEYMSPYDIAEIWVKNRPKTFIVRRYYPHTVWESMLIAV